jgi:hypothetical protein
LGNPVVNPIAASPSNNFDSVSSVVHTRGEGVNTRLVVVEVSIHQEYSLDGTVLLDLDLHIRGSCDSYG